MSGASATIVISSVGRRSRIRSASDARRMRSSALDVRCGITRRVTRRAVATDATPSATSAASTRHDLGAEVRGVVEVLAQAPVALRRRARLGRRLDDDREQRRAQDRGGRRRPAQGARRGRRRIDEHEDPFADRLAQPCGPDVLELGVDASGDEPQGQLAQRRQVRSR